MSLDIDKFLERLEDKDEKKPIGAPQKERTYEVNLDFQKEVEDKLEHIKKDMTHEDFAILKNVYQEVKKFDQDLPNKFMGIEKKSSLTLKDVGDLYSSEFSKKTQEHVQHILDNIHLHLKQIDELLNKKQYVTILRELDVVKKLAYQFPKGFLKEKMGISYEIKEREVQIFAALEEYKKIKMAEIKKNIKQELNALNECLKLQNPQQIEKKLVSIQLYLDQMPKILISNLTREHTVLTSTIMKVEEHLHHLYIKEFDRKKGEILVLFDKFKTHQLQNEVREALIVYDEILLRFEQLPEVDLKEKVRLYSHINTLYSSINNLIINNNVSMFLEAYKSSKELQEIKEYLDHLLLMGTGQSGNLEIIKKRIENLPPTLNLEKDELRKRVAQVLSKTLDEKKKKLVEKKAYVNKSNEIDKRFEQLKKTHKKDEFEKLFKELKLILEKSKLTTLQKDAIVKRIDALYEEKRKTLS